MKKIHIIIAVLAIIAVQGLPLYFLGRTFTCDCWPFVSFDAPATSENSQLLIDWYSFIHVLYGVFAYFIAKTVVNKKYNWPIGVYLLLALVISAGWEIYENTNYFINIYKELSPFANYVGDSMINSLVDTLSVGLGFLMARYLPIWLVILIAVTLEILVNWNINDGFFISSTMFFYYPLAAMLYWLN